MNKGNFVILSKLFLFDGQNELIPENLSLADQFIDNGIKILILGNEALSLQTNLSNHTTKYSNDIFFISRSKLSWLRIRDLKNKFNFVLVGVVDQDAIFSFHTKIPLFNPSQIYGFQGQVETKVEHYGLPIQSFSELIECIKTYEIHESNYFELSTEDRFFVKSLNNAMYFYSPEDEKRIKMIFERSLKSKDDSADRRVLLVLLFHLMTELINNPEYEEIEYWGIFPSSKVGIETSMTFIKESIRQILGGKPKKQKGSPVNDNEILIRTENMNSKRSTGDDRLSYKSSKDFETLIVNPKLKGKLDGKVVCILDDYITNGYSAEAAKHLLLSAGARKVYFISIGKFGKKYFSPNYILRGDVFTQNYEGQFLGEKTYHYDGYSSNDHEILGFGQFL